MKWRQDNDNVQCADNEGRTRRLFDFVVLQLCTSDECDDECEIEHSR